MKKILLSLLILAASLNVMATDFAVATLTLKGNTSLEQGEVTLAKTDDPAASSFCAPLYIDQYHVVMYAINSSEKYQIWANADLTNFPLGIKTYSDASYTITVSNVSGSETLTLYDAVKNQTIALTAGQTYDFTAAANSTIEDRFIINYVPAPTPTCTEVRNGLNIDQYYTICLPKAVTAANGASFWNMTNRGDGVAYLVEAELPLVAGRPYIFQAEAEELCVFYSGEDAAAGTYGALHGTFAAMDQAALDAAVAANDGSDIYLLNNNALWKVNGQSDNHLAPNRAYIVYNLLDYSVPNQVPGRRVRAIPMQGQGTTGVDNLNATEAPVKTVIDGKLYIIRGEHMFDATGRMVK